MKPIYSTKTVRCQTKTLKPHLRFSRTILFDNAPKEKSVTTALSRHARLSVAHSLQPVGRTSLTALILPRAVTSNYQSTR